MTQVHARERGLKFELTGVQDIQSKITVIHLNESTPREYREYTVLNSSDDLLFILVVSNSIFYHMYLFIGMTPNIVAQFAV